MLKNNLKTTLGLFLGILALVIPFLIDIDGLNYAGQLTLGIFMMAGIFWITEPIPIYATSLLIIFLQVLFLSDKGFIDFANAPDYTVESYKTFYATLASPIIILFLGGFSLATAAVKYGLDRSLTRLLIKPFGTRPQYVCLGMMLATALLSAFMSNTATTAMMITMVAPILIGMSPQDPFRKGIVLSIPVAANIGGIATPIGSPPNAIALSALREQGINIAFSTWMLLAVPVVLLMLFIAWRMLLILFPPSGERVEIDFSGKMKRSKPAMLAAAIFALTVALWITEKLHGISTTVVAFLPIAMLPALGVLKTDDIRRFSWEVLWLVAGGISIGISLKTTGLAAWLIGLVEWDALNMLSMIVLFALVAYIIANLVSNTVTATLFVPLAMGLGLSEMVADSFPLARVIVLIAVIVSFSMMLPISTPPNAIAMSSGNIQTSDMAKVGVLVGVCAFIVCGIAFFFYWPFIIQ